MIARRASSLALFANPYPLQIFGLSLYAMDTTPPVFLVCKKMVADSVDEIWIDGNCVRSSTIGSFVVMVVSFFYY